MPPKTPPSPSNTIIKRKRGRPRKSETEGTMPNSINQPSQKRKPKPKKLKVASNPLELFQNITNEDEVVEFEVEKIVDKEVDPITNQVWYWVKFRDISDAQKIAAEDCNCEDIIQDYERRISRKRKYTKKASQPEQSSSVSSPLSRNSPTNILPLPTNTLSQDNNNSTLDGNDSSSEDDDNSDNEQPFESWPKSVVEKRTTPAGDVQYRVKFESIFYRWVNPKTDNTSSRQTLQELCNEYEKAITNKTIKHEKTVEEERRARIQSQPLRDSSISISNSKTSNNNNSNNNDNDMIRLLLEEVKSLRKEQDIIKLQEEQTRKEEEQRRQQWLSKVTQDLEERLTSQESLLKEKEDELRKRVQQQEQEIQRKMKEADDKVIMANHVLQAEEQRLQEYASKIREAQKFVVAGKPTEPAQPLQSSHPAVPTTAPPPHPHVPHAASPSTDSGVSSPPGHSAPNTPSEDNCLQNSIALMFQQPDPSHAILSSDPALSFGSPDASEDIMGFGGSYSLGNDTPRSVDMYRFCNSLDFLQLQNHPPTTISPTALHQDMGWPYSLPEETSNWDEITDDLQKETTDGGSHPQPLPATTITHPRPHIPPPQLAARPLHVPRINLPQGATAKLANGDLVSVPGGKPKAPTKRKTKPKTDEPDKKVKKAVSKKTTAPPVKPPIPVPKAPG